MCEGKYRGGARFDGIYSPGCYFDAGIHKRVVFLLKETYTKKGDKPWHPVEFPDNEFDIHPDPKNKVASLLFTKFEDYFNDGKKDNMIRGVGYINLIKRAHLYEGNKTPSTDPKKLLIAIEEDFDQLIFPQLQAMKPNYVILCGVVNKRQPIFDAIKEHLVTMYGMELKRKAIASSNGVRILHEINNETWNPRRASLWQGFETPGFIQTYHPPAYGKYSFYPDSDFLKLLDRNKLIDW